MKTSSVFMFFPYSFIMTLSAANASSRVYFCGVFYAMTIKRRRIVKRCTFQRQKEALNLQTFKGSFTYYVVQKWSFLLSLLPCNKICSAY